WAGARRAALPPRAELATARLFCQARSQRGTRRSKRRVVLLNSDIRFTGRTIRARAEGERPLRLPSPQRAALDIISVEVTSKPPPAVAEIASQDTLITTPWLQPEFHGDVPALPVHVIGTYYGAPSRRVWRNGRIRLEGVGRPDAFTIVPAHLWGRWDIEVASPLSYVLLSDTRL